MSSEGVETTGSNGCAISRSKDEDLLGDLVRHGNRPSLKISEPCDWILLLLPIGEHDVVKFGNDRPTPSDGNKRTENGSE